MPSPDIALKALILKGKYAPLVRDLSPHFVSKAIHEAERYEGIYLAFWRSIDTDFMVAYRLDRPPNNAEIHPWLQALFDKPGNGQIHEWACNNYRFFFEGNVYTTDSIADMMGNAFADSVEKTDSRAEAFDFDKTELGKKLNGRRTN